MSDKIDGFLDSVCACIKYKPIHQDIRGELATHINELTEQFTEEGASAEDALDMAISAMGDCGEIGRQLNKRHKPQTEWSLIGLTAVIAIIGGIVMYSSSRFVASVPINTVSFGRYLFSAAMGITLMAGVYFFDYTRLKKLAWPVYLLALALMAETLVFGKSMNGRRFFFIGDLAISTEFISVLLIASFAGFVDKARGRGSMEIVKLSLLASVSILPILLQPRLVQSLTLLIGYTAIIVFAVMRGHFGGSTKRQWAVLGVLSSIGGAMLVVYSFAASYRMARLASFFTRGRREPYGVGFQQVMADKWLSASNFFGASAKKVSGGELYTTLPEATTDYVIVNVFVTLGRAIGAFLIIIIALYIVRLFATSCKIKNSYGCFLSLGACTIISVQFVIGILVNFGLFPVASVYIPFISYGGTGYVSCMALVGLVLSAWRRNNLITALN